MYIPAEIIDQTFDPLVGNPAATETFRSNLADAVHGGAAGEYWSDPYCRLGVGAQHILNGVIYDTEREDPIDSRYHLSLEANGKLGVDLTVSTMKALGSIYMRTVSEPQDIYGVQKNASVALRHTYGGAHNGKFVGFANVWANALGLSPRNPAVWAAVLAWPVMYMPEMRRGFQAVGVSPETFKSEVSDAGQLTIQPRHRRIGKKWDRACPATQSKVATPEGMRSGLLTFMKTIGEVAINEIYRQEFDIRD